MLKKLVKVTAAIAIAAALQIGAKSLAYQERGYEAVGGEMMVFPVAVYIEYLVFLRDRECGLEECVEGCDGE